LATTGAERPASRQLLVPLLVAVAASCVSGSVPSGRPARGPTPEPVTAQRDPEIRIGIAVGAATVSVGANDAVLVNEPDGARVTTIPPAQIWQISTAGQALVLMSPGGWVSRSLDALALAAADPAVPLRINGRPYRGVIELLRDPTGITAVNRLGLEGYVQGVVSAEMGRRGAGEQAALEAQAVVSRTFAIRNLGRRKAQGFDLSAGISDQVYAGVAGESPEGRAAVMATRGQVLTYNGMLVEAFFYSTCGGRTADGVEVFRGAAQPYLRSVADQAENGVVYCSISPRYRWHEEWSDQSLRATLQRNLPEVAGVRMEDVRQVRDIRVARRSGSGRVDQLAIALGGPEIRVSGPAIRQVLRSASGELLRSNAFSLAVTGGGGRVTHLSIDGVGSGHGVGLCQWGAVGRARAGQGYQQILAAYFPGTRVVRRY
jgi:stage II sporulation protein D